MTLIRELFRLSVTHGYYNGKCRDFEFVFPSDTLQLMEQGKMLARVVDDTLYVVYETDDEGAPRFNMAGRQFRVGLRLTNPYFTNFTDVPEDFLSTIGVYYMGDINVVELSGRYPLVGSVLTHTLSSASRPAIITLYDALGVEVVTKVVTDPGEAQVQFDATGRPGGMYRVRETFPDDINDIWYYVDSELKRMGATCVFDTILEGDLYTAANTFTIPFNARQEVLRYYVIAKNYSESDFNALEINDAGYSTDGRPQVFFTKVAPGSFTPDELPRNMVENGVDRVIMFKSTTDGDIDPTPDNVALPRMYSGRKKIQLSKGVDLLLANLPQPGPEKADSHMIIHLSKPQP